MCKHSNFSVNLEHLSIRQCFEYFAFLSFKRVKKTKADSRQMKHTIWLQGYLAFFIILFKPCKGGPITKGEVVKHYVGVLGDMVILPCNITAPLDKDEAELVLWYKETIESPVYSADARMVARREPQHFVHNMWDSRAYFNMFHKPTGLKIINLKLEDAGVYRCRVDFKKSRTVNFKMTLDIIVPPSSPIITNEQDEIVSGKIGPVPEGGELELKCETTGGSPHPALKWFVDDKEMTRFNSRTYGTRSENTLTIDNVKRSYKNANITCIAINNNITAPKSSSVTLLLNLKPVVAKIIRKHRPMIAGNSYKFVCESRGSIPPAHISWWRRGKRIKNTHLTISLNKSISTSVVTIVASPEDHGKILNCRATNTRIQDSVVEDKLKLEVHFAPIVKLSINHHSKNKNDVQSYNEGEEVKLRCFVRANPLINGMRWYHDDRMMTENDTLTGGIAILNGTSLHIMASRYQHNGKYKCSATNSIGTIESNVVTIHIKYSPICASNLRKEYFLSDGDVIKIPCQVHSYPGDVKFTWKFNGSYRTTALKTFSTVGSTSTLEFSQKEINDYGMLFCEATNSVGKQKIPCKFRILIGGKPGEIRSCSVIEHNDQLLKVKCDKRQRKSFTATTTGGAAATDAALMLNQTYVMEVYNRDHKLQANVTKTGIPVFAVSGLSPNIDLFVRIYTGDRRGRSKVKTLNIQALVKENPDKSYEGWQIKKLQPIIGAVVGLVVSLIFIAISIVFILKCRKPRQEDGFRSVALPASTSSLTKQASNKTSVQKLENGTLKKSIASIMGDDGGSAFWDYCVSSLDSSSPQIRENALPLEHSSVYFKRKSRLPHPVVSIEDIQENEPVAGCEIPLMMKSTVEVSL